MKKALAAAVSAILLSTALSAALVLHPLPGPAGWKPAPSTPAGPANATVPADERYNLSEHRLLKRLVDALFLDNGTLSRLERDGFSVVSGQNASFINFVRAYKYYYVKDLPVFITTDTILNVFHLLLEKVLETYEQEWIGPSMQKTALELYNDSLCLYEDGAIDQNVSRELVVYFAVPNLVFDPSFKYPPELAGDIVPIMNRIASATAMELFPGQDYTQYKVRGHYTNTEYLGKYFKAMMWMQRSLFSLDRTAQVMQVWAITHLLSSNRAALASWEKVNTVLDFLVGTPDAMTYEDVLSALRHLFGASDLSNLDERNAGLLSVELLTGNYSRSRIIGCIVPEGTTDAPPAWSLMGQRYVLDAGIMQNVIADIVPEFQDRYRLLPSGLDIAAALGSGRARELLGPEIERYNYSSFLDNQTRQVRELDPAFWNLSVYNMLLDAYRPLLANETSPPQRWMNASGWRTEKVNSVLGSYAELKYDTILYTVQTYGGGCSYPYGYVEPYPEFYEKMARLCGRMEALVGQAPLPVVEWISYSLPKSAPQKNIRFHPTFSNLEGICRMLANISRAEMAGSDLSAEQWDFIQDIVDVTRGRGTQGCPPPVGWLTDLLRANHIDEYGTDSRIVADICSNANWGTVREIATGDIQTLVVLVTAPNGTKFVAAGPVYSYYEFEMPMTGRLTADEWRDMLAADPPARPEWAGDFLG